MATAVVRVRGLSPGTLNHINGLSDDIWVEWPAPEDVESCPQIVGTFDQVDDGFVVLKWKQEEGARGWLGIPMDRVEAVITVKGGFETQKSEGDDDDEAEEPEEDEEAGEEGESEEEEGEEAADESDD